MCDTVESSTQSSSEINGIRVAKILNFLLSNIENRKRLVEVKRITIKYAAAKANVQEETHFTMAKLNIMNN
jgi:hypothetical protein